MPQPHHVRFHLSMADTDHEALLRETYAAFNARDIDAVLAVMHSDVDWPNAWEGGRVHGHEGVREYWRRQWMQIDPTVEPTAIAPPDEDGRVAVTVHSTVRNLEGDVLDEGTVTHVYTFKDGLISRMEVRE
jgi:ketosteroid isomerase-like protein